MSKWLCSMSAERAASQALCGRAEDSQVPHLLTLGRIFLVERAVRSCKGLLRGCLGAVGYVLCILYYDLSSMHFALCTVLVLLVADYWISAQLAIMTFHLYSSTP